MLQYSVDHLSVLKNEWDEKVFKVLYSPAPEYRVGDYVELHSKFVVPDSDSFNVPFDDVVGIVEIEKPLFEIDELAERMSEEQEGVDMLSGMLQYVKGPEQRALLRKEMLRQAASCLLIIEELDYADSLLKKNV